MINFSRTTNQIVTQVEDRTGAPAPLHAPTKLSVFLGRKENWPLCPAHRGYAVVQVHLLCLLCVTIWFVVLRKDWPLCPPPQEYAVVQVHLLCLKAVCAWFVAYKKNWPLCPAHRGYAVVQVHLLCSKAVWQQFLYRTLEPSADGRRSTCTTGSPSRHSDRGPLEVHQVWEFSTCSCNCCFG